jgi:hypothetical protein
MTATPPPRLAAARIVRHAGRAVCCSHCNAPVAIDLVTALVIGPVRLLRAVTMVCQRCHHELLWRPGTAPAGPADPTLDAKPRENL